MLRQPSGVAFQVFDARSVRMLRTIDYEAPGATRVDADTLGELAEALGIDAERFERTVREFNAAIVPGEFDPAVKDGLRTEGLAVPKSNWALPIEQPPFTAFPVTCGITFTFGGVRVDADARVLDLAGRPLPGLFAAGELVGGLFFHNYPGRLRADRGHGLRTSRRVRRRNYGIGRRESTALLPMSGAAAARSFVPMNLYAIRRRDFWGTPEELQQTAARSAEVGEEMSDDIRWIRTYVVQEESGKLGTVCLYEGTSAAKVREQAERTGMPADEITLVADTVIVRPDPVAA